jgi:hypothetical protein
VRVAGALVVTAACGNIVGLSPKAPPVIAASGRAPAFTLPANHPGTTVSLATALAASDVVLVFYRGHW